MKKITLSAIAILFSLVAFCQKNDLLVKHNGEKLEVKVLKVGETTVSCKYPGEDAEQTIGKFAVPQ